MDIEQVIWGATTEGEPIVLYTMTNSKGEWVKLTNLGATIVGVGVKDKDGVVGDVVLGYKDWQSYQGDGAAMGKSVGRYANRIARGKFTLDGVDYRLAINNGPNALHGGPTGFQNRIWQSRVEGDRVVFNYVSTPGEEGYPGECGVEACYDWDNEGNLEITYFASTDSATIVNLTNHVYFNLKGDGQGTIEDHHLQLAAEKWLPTDSVQIPTGELAAVEGTPMDFRTSTVIGSRIEDDFEALKIGKGYDHCWAVDGWEKGKMSYAGELYSEQSGRYVKVSTTQVGIQIYTGNWLEGSPEGKHGEYVDRSGVALECQAFPDSPNKANFPSVELRKGEVYEQHIVYSFGVR